MLKPSTQLSKVRVNLNYKIILREINRTCLKFALIRACLALESRAQFYFALFKLDIVQIESNPSLTRA